MSIRTEGRRIDAKRWSECRRTSPGRLRSVMEPCRALKGVVLSPRAPSEVRKWVSETLELEPFDRAELERETVLDLATLASELIADATDHASDEATIRLTVDEATVCVEVFDAPRRSVVAV